MNPWASLLAQFAAQAVSQEGPILLQDLEAALNSAFAPHNHTVAITPTAPQTPAS